MRNRRVSWLVILAVVLVLIVVSALLWRWWSWLLPSSEHVKAWIDYLNADLEIGRWVPVALIFIVADVELLTAFALQRRSGAYERHLDRLDRLHASEVKILEQQIALSKEEQHAFQAELELRDDLIREETDQLWSQLDQLRQEGGLPDFRRIPPTVPELSPELRSDMRQIVTRLERIETVASASVRRAQNTDQVHQRADELARLGGACYYLGQHEQALTYYNKAIGLAAGDSEALIGRALVNCALHQHKGVLQDLERALKLNEEPRVYLYRGLCREQLGDDKRAMEDYARIIRLNPGFVEAYYRRGLLYARQGEYAKAFQDQDKALELDSGHAGACTARGAARAVLGDSQAALADLDRACIMAPQGSEAFYQRGLVHHQLDMNDEALADLARAIELEPFSAPAYAARAEIHLAMGDHTDAVADYDRAIELQRKNATIYNARGMARVAAQDYRGAIGDFNCALEFDPALAVAYAHRGAAYEKVGDYDQAIRDLDRSLVLNPYLAIAYYSRGMAYGSKGEYDRASRDLNKAVELDPSLGDDQKTA